MKTISSFSWVFYVFLMCFVSNSAWADPPLRLVKSQGVAEIQAMPDMAYLTGAVVVEEKTTQAAMDGAQKQLSSLVKWILAQEGVDSKDLQAAQIQVSPRWEYQKGGKRILLGYQARADVRLVLRDLTHLSGWYQSLVSNGLTSINPAQFDFSRRDELELEAIAKASEMSRARANAAAMALNQSLGDVHSIQIDSHWRNPPMPRLAMAADAVESADAAPVNIGEHTIRASVNASFVLRP